MALIRDPNFVKQIAQSHDIKSISEEACRMILSEMELKLRLVVEEAIKYMKHFNRETLRCEDINYALKDLNFSEIYGYEATDSCHFTNIAGVSILGNKELELKSLILREVSSMKTFIKPKISMRWLSAEGSIPAIEENLYIKCKKDFDNENMSTNEVESEKMYTETEIIFKEQAPSLLSKEMENFLKTVLDIIRAENSLIDEKFLKGQYQESKEFKKILTNFQQSYNITNILPFFFNFILQDYDKKLFNGIKKKILIIKLIIALQKNISISLEFHVFLIELPEIKKLHVVIKILVFFISSNELTINPSEEEFFLRNLAAKSLAQIVLQFEDKYVNLKYDLARMLMEIFEDTKFCYPTTYGILQFFEFMDTGMTKSFILPIIPDYLKSAQFYQDLNYIPFSAEGIQAQGYKKVYTEETKKRNKEANMVYISIQRLCNQLLAQLTLLSQYNKDEAAAIYGYLFDIFGETILPSIIKNFQTEGNYRLFNLYKKNTYTVSNYLDI